MENSPEASRDAVVLWQEEERIRGDENGQDVGWQDLEISSDQVNGFLS